VFAIDLVCALTWRDGLPRPQRPLVVLAAAIILGSAILSVRVMGLNAAALAHLDLDKSELGLMRLAHFLAVAYVIAVVGAVEPLATPIRRIIRSWTRQSLQGMGRNSLFFFALGSVVSTGGCSLMAAARSLGTAHLIIHLIGFVYIAAAVVGMFAVVRRMERPTGPLVRSTEIGDALAAPLVYRSAPLPSDKDPDVAPLLAPGAGATKSSPRRRVSIHASRALHRRTFAPRRNPGSSQLRCAPSWNRPRGGYPGPPPLRAGERATISI
jgi:OpgC protein